MTRVAEASKIVETLTTAIPLGPIVGDLYTVPQHRQALVTSIMLHSVDPANANVARLFLEPVGGTSRRVLYQTIAAGEDGPKFPRFGMNEGDIIRGFATTLAKVVIVISRQEEYML